MNKEIRDLDFLSWVQPSAWMESMSGTRWDNLLKTENQRFENAVKKVASKEELYMKKDEFYKNRNFIYYKYKDLLVKRLSRGLYEYVLDKKTYVVTDLNKKGDLIFQIRDVGNGAEKYRLECFNKDSLVWSFNNVSSEFYIKDNSIFLLKATNKLWYNNVIELNMETY